MNNETVEDYYDRVGEPEMLEDFWQSAEMACSKAKKSYTWAEVFGMLIASQTEHTSWRRDAVKDAGLWGAFKGFVLGSVVCLGLVWACM